MEKENIWLAQVSSGLSFLISKIFSKGVFKNINIFITIKKYYIWRCRDLISSWKRRSPFSFEVNYLKFVAPRKISQGRKNSCWCLHNFSFEIFTLFGKAGLGKFYFWKPKGWLPCWSLNSEVCDPAMILSEYLPGLEKNIDPWWHKFSLLF